MMQWKIHILVFRVKYYDLHIMMWPSEFIYVVHILGRRYGGVKGCYTRTAQYLGSGWAELQTDSSLYQNGSLLLNISWGKFTILPATLWLQLRTHPLIEKPSWLINWWWMILSLGHQLWFVSCVVMSTSTQSPAHSTTGENFPLIPEQHEAGPGQGPGQAWEHHFKLKTASPS